MRTRDNHKEPLEAGGPLVACFEVGESGGFAPAPRGMRGVAAASEEERDQALSHVELAAFYEAHQRLLGEAGLVDFGDQIHRTLGLLRDRSALRAALRARYRYVLVDEFQDTNGIQYDWLRQLVGKTGAPFVVGDDDQSVYRWRGAKVENMQHFRREFGAVVYKLEQNYRSTAVILAAANPAGARAPSRRGRAPWRRWPPGRPRG